MFFGGTGKNEFGFISIREIYFTGGRSSLLNRHQDHWGYSTSAFVERRGRPSLYVPFTWNTSDLQIRSPRVTALIASKF
jgi:hypothetical protein